MEKIIAENIKRICKEQGKQLKDLAAEMGIDPPSLNRAMYGNPQLSTLEKAAFALGVSCKSLFEPINEDSMEGYIKVGSKIYQFNSKEELEFIINKR
ncbi:XRE family transcriptional regulator [Bacteroides sp. 214]|uniref:helix-turn-helix domain-containing protein n=1 Tax=Bacteroides sp. 214 TaxID=2302935 RepID=UPI0013D57785|nr:helix-turn-helix transcriptional regulator [Bacteroides sp. 214]NDW13524.1 XRE family transcriptional regulator [Bacteroides sp. 214]